MLKNQSFEDFRDSGQNANKSVIFFVNSRFFLKAHLTSVSLRMSENLAVQMSSLKLCIINSKKISRFTHDYLSEYHFVE